MRRVLAALALGALLALPHAAAAPAPRFPAEVEALLPGWIADAEALAANDTAKAWYPEAKAFLDSAKAAQAQGRVRSALFDLETFTELTLAGQLADEAAPLPSEAEKKSLVLQRTAQWHAEATSAWEAYRARLKSAEAEIRSLQALEMALYGADQALTARLMLDEREPVAREFPKQASLDPGYVLSLVRSSHTVLLDLRWSDDLLDVAGRYEGLPPRVDEAAWANVTAQALTPVPEGSFPAQLDAYEKVAKGVREANESTMAVAIALAEQRASRATSIYVIYGDAQSRGLNVTRDATRAMGRQLDNTSVDAPAGHGLLGIQVADAVDRAIKTREFAQQNRTDLGVVIGAWSGLDHAQYVTNLLAGASPVEPAPTTSDSPAPGAALALLALGLVALAARRRA